MKHKLLLFALATGLSFTGFSQTKGNIEKALNDPQRPQNEARADVRAVDATKITDTDGKDQKTEATKPEKKKRKKKGCCKSKCSK